MQSLNSAEKEAADMLALIEQCLKNAHFWSREGAHRQAQEATLMARGAVIELKEALQIVSWLA